MTLVEIILLIIGIAAFVASFFVRASGEQLSHEERKRTDEEIKARVDKQMQDAAARLDHAVDDAVSYAVEKTERSLERVSNEKIMGVSEYADTVLTDIHKNHEEVVFLYDMLNDKQTALKNAVTEIEKTAKAAAVLAKEAKESAASAAAAAKEAADNSEEAAESAAQAADNADEASQIAQEATQSIDEAINGADEALRRASDAAAKADTALRAAEDAALRADSARQTAGAAAQTANEAILSADTARQAAEDAMKGAKEVQKVSGVKSVPTVRQRTAGNEQNLSGLARMQGIREAQNEAENLLKEKEAEKTTLNSTQEPEGGEHQPQTALQKEPGEKAEPERVVTTQESEKRVPTVPQPTMTEKVKPQEDAGISLVDIRQKTTPGETEGFRPFVIPRVKVLGEPVAEETEIEAPRLTRTRSVSSTGRRRSKKVSDLNGVREESELPKEVSAGGRADAGPERKKKKKILAMHQEGKSNIAIARELGIGVGEVKLVIDLFRM